MFCTSSCGYSKPDVKLKIPRCADVPLHHKCDDARPGRDAGAGLVRRARAPNAAEPARQQARRPRRLGRRPGAREAPAADLCREAAPSCEHLRRTHLPHKLCAKSPQVYAACSRSLQLLAFMLCLLKHAWCGTLCLARSSVQWHEEHRSANGSLRPPEVLLKA